LAPWEYHLLSELTMEVDCYDFVHLVNTQFETKDKVQLISVSDGSDDSGSMTFGWAIALPDGRRLARCSGPAFGPTGSSFRAEGYGFLSVSRFIIRIQEFCSSDAPWSITMLTDNQGLLTRIATSLQYIIPFPNFTLLPDWDMTNEIAETLRLLPTPPLLVHVKGHQDDHHDYSELSLEAQLNVDADTEAGYHQCTYPGQRPVVP
jgi:hypothetical protein